MGSRSWLKRERSADFDDLAGAGGGGEMDEGVGDFAVEGFFAEAADEDGDIVGALVWILV